jgi:hypothetical protein
MGDVGKRTAVGVLLASSLAFSAASGDDARISVRGVIKAPPAPGPASFRVLLIPVAPDDDGIYRVAGGLSGSLLDCDPTGGSGGEFVMELVVGREYELRVDLLDPEGYPRQDGTYYFAGFSDPDQERRTPVGVQGEVPIPLRFEWSPRAATRGNFLLPRRSPRGGFDVTQYIALGSAAL